MITITPFIQNARHQAQLVDLIHYCQNIEAGLDIKMAEQDDIFEISSYYQKNGGQFWIALDDDNVVGTIALLPIDAEHAVLKKFFTYPEYRGDPQRLGRKLYQELLAHAKDNHFSKIVLDTPEKEGRSHFFYEKQGFKRIQNSELTVSYPFPDRDSRIYELTL